ncbi:hypothetical protein CSOJ01_14273 [Colletotrichum sojae]|uniref:Uncharacterized protein n=1 Tax=Colletotrichum sojae TaxID=2175907 RepID=A0A8H6IQA7_9PEZI|nr:hypothetical protein CSOJ01_14273 [Colletotrichum sojae]
MARRLQRGISRASVRPPTDEAPSGTASPEKTSRGQEPGRQQRSKVTLMMRFARPAPALLVESADEGRERPGFPTWRPHPRAADEAPRIGFVAITRCVTGLQRSGEAATDGSAIPGSTFWEKGRQTNEKKHHKITPVFAGGQHRGCVPDREVPAADPRAEPKVAVGEASTGAKGASEWCASSDGQTRTMDEGKIHNALEMRSLFFFFVPLSYCNR